MFNAHGIIPERPIGFFKGGLCFNLEGGGERENVCLCVFTYVSAGVHMSQHTCRHQETPSVLNPSLPPCLELRLSPVTVAYARPAGP